MYNKRPGFLPYLFGGITGISVGLLIVAGFLLYRSSQSSPNAQTGVSPPPADYYSASIEGGRRNAIVSATEKVAPAVVNITNIRTVTYRIPSFWEDLFRRNWRIQKRPVGSYGSGFIIRPDGYIITNQHVVSGAEDIIVTLATGEELSATLVGEAPRYDIALLKVDARDLPYARLGNSNNLLVGEWMIAIGSPFGHLLEDPHPTVTVGVLSAFHRDVKAEVSDKVLMDMIQTDAAINPGNSGGPLVNSRGEVIGINTFIFSQSGGSIGIGFAIPINRADWVIKELITYGRVRPVYMGMSGMDITPTLAAGLNLDERQGVLVNEIHEDGPAQRAGIRPGDLLVSINGIPLRNIDHVNRVVFGARVGDELKIEVKRKGEIQTVNLVLEERPDEI